LGIATFMFSASGLPGVPPEFGGSENGAEKILLLASLYISLHSEPASELNLLTIWSSSGTQRGYVSERWLLLTVGYILQIKVLSVSSSVELEN
jgi:hypothetical protein